MCSDQCHGKQKYRRASSPHPLIVRVRRSDNGLTPHTGHVVLTHKDFLLCQQMEIARMRSLTRDGLPWMTGRRTKEDGIFEEDPVTPLYSIKDNKARILRIDIAQKSTTLPVCLTKTSPLSLRETDWR